MAYDNNNDSPKKSKTDDGVHKHYGDGGRAPKSHQSDHGVSEGTTGYSTVLKKG